ncbi:DUF4123 domain-containing protein [Desulfomicrobium salsuginis]
MDNAGRPAHRIVEDIGPCLREAVARGCALWIVLDPLCHEQALAQLYEHEQGADIEELFRKTPLFSAHAASPRVCSIAPESSMLRWLCEAAPPNWGMVLASDAPRDEILDHLRSLLLVRTDESDVIFRVWDGTVLSRMCMALPEEIPVLLGPVRRVAARTHTRSWACIDRDGQAFMEAPHRPACPLPRPWYRITKGHERAFDDQRPANLVHTVMETLLREQAGPVLPPTVRLNTFTARHVERALALGLWRAEAVELFVRCCLLHGESFPEAQSAPGPFSRRPVDEDMAILAMRRTLNHGGNRD